jgi:hypothetical protein
MLSIALLNEMSTTFIYLIRTSTEIVLQLIRLFVGNGSNSEIVLVKLGFGDSKNLFFFSLFKNLTFRSLKIPESALKSQKVCLGFWKKKLYWLQFKN